MIIRLLCAMSCLLIGTSALAGSDRPPVGSSQGVTSVAVRSDARLMLSGGHDGTARLWDVGTGKEAKRLFDGRNPIAEPTAIPLPRDVMAVTFSLGGSVAAGGIRDGTVRVWEVESGREMMVLRGHEDGVLAVAFSADSNRVAAGGYDWTVRVWDRKTGKPLHRFEKHQGSVRGVAFVANGSQVASAGDDGTVRFWDLTTGELLKTVELQCGPIHAMAVSQDQSYLAAACRNGTAM